MDKSHEKRIAKTQRRTRGEHTPGLIPRPRNNLIGKRQAMIAYRDSGFKNSRLSKTNWFATD